MFHVKQWKVVMNSSLESYVEKAKACYELKELERLGLTPEMEQRELILSYICLILKWNEYSNIIPENEVDKLFLRYFCDSLQPLLLFGFKKNAVILDIGSSGGFPFVPIRIFRPDLKFVVVESNRKKMKFLNEVISELKFDNIETYNCKVDNLELPDVKYDYVISRGISSLQKFSQLAKPYLLQDGHMYTFKTKQFANELDFITNNKEKDGVKISEIAEYDLGNQMVGLNLVSLELV